MRISVLKYMKYLWTGYMWGRCISSLYAFSDNPEKWYVILCYAFFSIWWTVFDIIEIRAEEKKWFDAEIEKTSILGARVYGTKEESEEK